MIDDLNVSYEIGSSRINLSTDTCDDNLPYNLADLFIRIIEDSNANEDMVISCLIDHFGYEKPDD